MEFEEVILTTKLNKDGRIYIPKDIRTILEIDSGERLKISINREGKSILLTKA